MPLDDWSPWILKGLLPMLEPRLVLFVLAPAQLYLSNGIPTTNQIVVANLENKPVRSSLAKLSHCNYRDVQSDSLHVHFLNDKYK